jgi:hypothetical protein
MNRVVVVIGGGTIQQILSDTEIELHLFDYDDADAGDKMPKIEKVMLLTEEVYDGLVKECKRLNTIEDWVN